MTHDQRLLTFDRYKLDLLRRVTSRESLVTSFRGFTQHHFCNAVYADAEDKCTAYGFFRTRFTRGKSGAGFTLIETIIYIALLSLLMTGAVMTAYDLISSASQDSVHASTQEEGSFAVRKMGWALSQLVSTSTPSDAFPYTHRLDITTTNGHFEMCLSGSTIYVRENGSGGACGDASYEPLTTINVNASTLGFQYIPANGSSPDGLQASTTIDGQDFTVTRYMRI